MRTDDDALLDAILDLDTRPYVRYPPGRELAEECEEWRSWAMHIAKMAAVMRSKTAFTLALAGDDPESPKVIWWAIVAPDPVRWWQRIRWRPWRKDDGYERMSLK